jgi:uncharacterized protein YlxP (DUF503 family)
MKPWIGVALVTVSIPGALSLKDRRQVVRSLTERLRRRFNAAVADLGPDGIWNRADVAVSCIGSSPGEMESRMLQLCSFVETGERDGEFEIADVRREVFSYGDF